MAAAYASYPPELSEEETQHLVTEINDWAIAHGLAVRPAPAFISSDVDPTHVTAVTAPVTLFPSLFPRQCFQQAQNAAKAYNELYSAIASDVAWLKPIVEELIEVDDFMKGLWDIHLKVASEGYVQPIQLGLFRSDYMVHMETGKLDAATSVKQVEFNTIASSFGGLSTRVSQLHEHLRQHEVYPERVVDQFHDQSLQVSHSAIELAEGLAQSYAAYGEFHHTRCVVFVVQDPERNVFDQRHVEYELKRKGIAVFRLPWNRVLKDTKLDDKRALIYTPPYSATKRQYEVTTVYFRAGYAPTEYENDESWASRLHIERSSAIKCPSVLLQLAGTKKVQQVLATPHSPHLAKFLPNKADQDIVQSTFAPIYPLDKSEAGLEARKLATNPSTAKNYVLKPQREGGGNNIYRTDIPAYLEKLPQEQWPAYILMEMIEPPAQRNTILRNGQLMSGNIICELGIYGICMWKEGDGVGAGHREIIYNTGSEYLLRTKGADSSEGGVAAGFGSVDSVCLIDL